MQAAVLALALVLALGPMSYFVYNSNHWGVIWGVALH